MESLRAISESDQRCCVDLQLQNQVALMSLSMHPLAASSSFRQAGVALKKRQAPDREGRRGEERRGGDAKANRDSPARKRSISGSGDDAA